MLQKFYNDLIAECHARTDNGVPIGFFADISIQKLKLIVIFQGRPISWPFVIQFARRMKATIERNSGLSTYEASNATAPGDLMVHFSLQFVMEVIATIVE